MIQIKANDYENIEYSIMMIGRQGEALTRQVIFDLTKLISDLGEGTASFVYRNPDGVQYVPVHQSRVDNYAVWTIDAADTSVNGQGLLELRFYPVTQSDDLYKTMIFHTYVSQSLGVPGPAPEPYEDVLEEMREIKDEAVGAKDDAEDARDAAAGSAEAAAGSAAAAEEAKDDAEDARDAAAGSAEAAAGSAAAAEESKEDAEAAATRAEEAAGSVENPVSYAPQTLTDPQKAQARQNINAAAPDGYYGESGGVMQFSKNFLGNNTPKTVNKLYFGPTASQMSGSEWSVDSISGKSATIVKIKGETLVRNQLNNDDRSSFTVNGVTFTHNSDNSYTINGTATENAQVRITSNIPVVNGHKYIFVFNRNAGSGITYTLWANNSYYWREEPSGSFIYTVANPDTDIELFMNIANGTTLSNIKFYIYCTDLSKMFSSGREPQTVEEFKAMSFDYYEYNPGKLIDFNGTGLKTVGFNLFDESKFIDFGLVKQSDGSYCAEYPEVLNNTVVWKNNLGYTGQVFLQYKAKKDYGEVGASGLIFCFNYTDGTESYAGYVGDGTYQEVIQLSLESKIVDNIVFSYGYNEPTFIKDFCINLSWSGIRNGEYEPYWESTLALQIADYFPDGMKSAGTGYDELTKDKAIKRISKVIFDGSDDEEWTTRTSDDHSFGIIVDENFPGLITGGIIDINIVSSWFSTESIESEDIGIKDGQYIKYTASYIITKMSCNTLDDFRAELHRNPLVVYYQLAEPVVTPISPELNLTYRCDDFGTEMLLPQNDDEPVTTPMDADIIYQLDYEADVRNMGQTMISKESMDSFIAAFNSSGLGNITQTWDSTNKKYSYVVTPPAPAE